MRLLISFLVIFVWLCDGISSFRCDRKPYGSTTQSSPPDGRFKLSVTNSDGTYIPEQIYTVQLSSTDGVSSYSLFMISAEGDMAPDPRNSRRLIYLNPGELRPQSSLTGKFSDRCLYSIEQGSIALKQSVEIYWQAPPSGNGCVTLRAMVAETENLWYEDGGPLSVKICEDMRQPDDVAPQINLDCQICDEAKYELTFTGVWSRNTHPQQFPENDWDNRYSDLVGASHTTEYILWSPGVLATPGLQDLAEHANTTQLETEILEKVGDGVRTLIKGKGHRYQKMRYPINTIFRTDKMNHLLTVAIGIHPSPDWFLGVNRFELCREDNTWLPERELNLFPWDAGTDSGVTYDSPNVQTFPQDAVARVEMSSYDTNSPFYEMDITELHPFGKLRIRLLRTYHRKCDEEEGASANNDEDKPDENANPDEPEPSRYQNSGDNGREDPLDVDPSSDEECPLSQWLEWSPCDGICINGKVRGYQWRERYHLVDGVAVEKYDPDSQSASNKEVPQHCKENYKDFERRSCTDDCNENDDITASRLTNLPVAPGHSWSSKREIDANNNHSKYIRT